MAYGRLGWTEQRFLNSTCDYFFKALKGFNDLEDQRAKGEWERLRLLGVWVLSPYQKKGSSLTPMSLLPLPWDRIETRDQWLKRHEHLKPIWDKLENIKK